MHTGCLCIWKPFVLFQVPTTKDECTVITNDCCEHPGDVLTIISDASVHEGDSRAAGACHLYKD